MSILKRKSGEKVPPHKRKDPKYPEPISAAYLERIFSDCEDFQTREVFPGLDGTNKITVCWIDGLVSGDSISEDVLRPLTEDERFRAPYGPGELIELILSGAVYSCVVKKRCEADEAAADLCSGYCALVFDSFSEALTFEVKTSNIRQISEPTIEKSEKGAKDAFVETVRVNTSLVRRKLRTAGLKSLSTVVGRQSGTPAVLMYLEDIAKPELVSSLQKRLDDIDIDGLLAAQDIEDYIADCPNTPFPQVLSTERPDKFAMGLLEGQVGLIVDGLPLGFLVPGTLASFMRVPDDESRQYIVASALRALRWLALLFSLLLPALFVAVAMYHLEMLPTKLLFSFIDSKQRVPFLVGTEVLSMLVAFELLQEAGLRLPDPVGQSVSIIGALIVGQSAVEARVVSPIPVIVVALAGVSGYAIPSRELGAALRLGRFLLVLAALAAGLFGLFAGLALILWHLSTLESFGLAYTSPLTDSEHGLLWTVLRSPMRKDKLRDSLLSGKNRRRQA